MQGIFKKEEMETVTLVQNPVEAVCISHSANSLGERYDPTILPAMGKYKGRLCSSAV